MQFVRTLLQQQPMAALFLTIAIGYLVGKIRIKGFSLGVGAVLFVALAVGWFAPLIPTNSSVTSSSWLTIIWLGVHM